MAEELVTAGNGANAPQAPTKRTVRKAPRRVEENKMDPVQAPPPVVGETPAVVETVTEAVVTTPPVEEAAPVAPPEAPAPAAEAKEKGLMPIVRRLGAVGSQVERLPGTRQVREAVTRVADQVGNSETTQKAVRRVRDGVREAADQVRQGAQDLERNPLVVAAHKVLLASVGAAALAQEEIEDFVNRLVERGTIAEADGRRMVKDVLDQRRKQMERAGERAQEMATEVRTGLTEGPRRLADDLEQRIESVLARMNIPTKEEIETLTAKITALTHKVDELKKTE